MASAPNFGQLFIESKGRAIEFQGKSLVLSDRIPAKLGQRFIVTIESTSSEHPQGVGISEQVLVFGELVKRAVVWEYFSLPPAVREQHRSALPFQFEVECRSDKGWLSFYNMTEYKSRQEWWHGGSCMWFEDIPGGRRYHCNDFELDDDFNDIVFTVSWTDVQLFAAADGYAAR